MRLTGLALYVLAPVCVPVLGPPVVSHHNRLKGPCLRQNIFPPRRGSHRARHALRRCERRWTLRLCVCGGEGETNDACGVNPALTSNGAACSVSHIRDQNIFCGLLHTGCVTLCVPYSVSIPSHRPTEEKRAMRSL